MARALDVAAFRLVVGGVSYRRRAPRPGMLQFGRRRQLQIEIKARAAPGVGLHTQLRPHGADELAADREPQSRTREAVARPARVATERLVQTAPRLPTDPPPPLAPAKLPTGPPLRPGADLNEPLIGEP